MGPTNLTELTPMIFNIELTHLGSEASIYHKLMGNSDKDDKYMTKVVYEFPKIPSTKRTQKVLLRNPNVHRFIVI